MQCMDRVEVILMDALSEYTNPLVISNVEFGSLSNQFERAHGLTITLDNGKVFRTSNPRNRIMKTESLVIHKAKAEDALEIINFLNAVGGESDYLTYGLNDFYFY